MQPSKQKSHKVITSFEEGLKSHGTISSATLYTPKKIDKHEKTTQSLNKIDRKGKIPLNKELYRRYTIAYDKFERAIRSLIRENITELTDKRGISYNQFCPISNKPINRTRPMDALSKKIDNTRVIFEFKYIRKPTRHNMNIKIKDAKNKIYKSGGLLSKLPDTKVKACLVMISEYETREPYTNLESAKKDSLINNSDDILISTISTTRVFELAMMHSIIITPYEEALIRSNISSSFRDTSLNKDLRQLIMPHIENSYKTYAWGKRK